VRALPVWQRCLSHSSRVLTAGEVLRSGGRAGSKGAEDEAAVSEAGLGVERVSKDPLVEACLPLLVHLQCCTRAPPRIMACTRHYQPHLPHHTLLSPSGSTICQYQDAQFRAVDCYPAKAVERHRGRAHRMAANSRAAEVRTGASSRVDRTTQGASGNLGM
jgi:hypothetical protein